MGIDERRTGIQVLREREARGREEEGIKQFRNGDESDLWELLVIH